MRICLFCENKYAVDILLPLQEYADSEGGHRVLWYVHPRKIPQFPLADRVEYTNSINEVRDFSPQAIFVPGNIVPYYLPGVKVQIFHGYAEKKGHFIIRRYFDTYFTQGPYFTARFQELAKKYKDFEVLETGWTRQDYIFRHLHAYDNSRRELLEKYGKKRILLYAPTFSPALSSMPFCVGPLRELAQKGDMVILLKFHPLCSNEQLAPYRQLAAELENVIFIEDFSVTPAILQCDLMVSDTSSTIIEALLLDKPVVTLRSALPIAGYWSDIDGPEKLAAACLSVLDNDVFAAKRGEIVARYDPHLDGLVAQRMFSGVRDYIARHGVPDSRKVNIWRKYRCIKRFGWGRT